MEGGCVLVVLSSSWLWGEGSGSCGGSRGSAGVVCCWESMDVWDSSGIGAGAAQREDDGEVVVSDFRVELVADFLRAIADQKSSP